jgi:hypothetical protein
MGLIDCSKTSVTNCQPTLCNIPEERRSHLHRGRSWKSRISEELKSHLSFLVCFLLCRNLISTAFKLLYLHLIIHMQVPYLHLKVCWDNVTFMLFLNFQRILSCGIISMGRNSNPQSRVLSHQIVQWVEHQTSKRIKLNFCLMMWVTVLLRNFGAESSF